ncbi:hypothetical protein PIB30_034259 [Stylosanthes scabra]|uniref:Uncharacterized protein n=1 Tax=Stylosanthes scabra TaxID=79078 RepID=A0ABU6WB19_9FABA|nr:hypothetical protein [Stylosanthes scabra]
MELIMKQVVECVGNCMMSRYGIDGDGNGRRELIAYVMVGSLGFGCLGVWFLKRMYRSSRLGSRRGPKPDKDDDVRSYLAADIVHSGELARQRLEDFKAAKANPETLHNAEKLLHTLLEREHPDLVMLQKTVGKLEMSGREDSAAEILRKAIKRANDEKKSHEAYEFQMLLVEMLIYKGKPNDLREALRCSCLDDHSLKDARRPLYKAMIYKMLDKTNDAETCWKEYIEVIDPHVHFDLIYVPRLREASPSQIDFQRFQQKVNRLQAAISKN